jgi:hypothetical protein
MTSQVPSSFAKCQRLQCSRCEDASGARFSRCGGCTLPYCSRACQVQDWKSGHKAECPVFSRYLRDPTTLDKDKVADETLRRVRLYLSVFAVTRHDVGARRGFVFVRADGPVAEFQWAGPSGPDGRALDRALLVQYITLQELEGFLEELPSLAEVVRSHAVPAASAYDPELKAVVVVVYSCGFATCSVMALVPDAKACRSIGAEHIGNQDRLELNIDNAGDEEGGAGGEPALEVTPEMAELLANPAVQQALKLISGPDQGAAAAYLASNPGLAEKIAKLNR